MTSKVQAKGPLSELMHCHTLGCKGLLVDALNFRYRMPSTVTFNASRLGCKLGIPLYVIEKGDHLLPKQSSSFLTLWG